MIAWSWNQRMVTEQYCSEHWNRTLVPCSDPLWPCLWAVWSSSNSSPVTHNMTQKTVMPGLLSSPSSLPSTLSSTASPAWLLSHWLPVYSLHCGHWPPCFLPINPIISPPPRLPCPQVLLSWLMALLPSPCSLSHPLWLFQLTYPPLQISHQLLLILGLNASQVWHYHLFSRPLTSYTRLWI